jgi:hypothetical protein
VIFSELVTANGFLRLPKGTTYPFVVVNTTANGSRTEAQFGTSNPYEVSFDPASIAPIGSASGGNLTFGTTAASSLVTLRRLNADMMSFSTFTGLTVVVDDTTLAENPLELWTQGNSVAVDGKLSFTFVLRSANGFGMSITRAVTATVSGALTSVDTEATSGVNLGYVNAGSTLGTGTIEQTGFLPGFVPPQPIVPGPPATVFVVNP